jgi:hypothetical protein
MSLRPLIIHFKDGIAALGSRTSISSRPMPGGPVMAERIERIPGGYLIGIKGRLFVVHNESISCAEVEEVAGDGEVLPDVLPPMAPPPDLREIRKRELEAEIASLYDTVPQSTAPIAGIIPPQVTVAYTPEELAARKAKQDLIDMRNADASGPKCPHGVPTTGICPDCVQANRLAAGLVPAGQAPRARKPRVPADEAPFADVGFIREKLAEGLSPEQLAHATELEAAKKRIADRKKKEAEAAAKLAAMTPEQRARKDEIDAEALRQVQEQEALEKSDF